MKNIPFTFGKIVSGSDFTDRVEETIHLSNNFKALTNTAIISPRRWGKSSLVEHAIENIDKSEKIKFIRLNAFGCRTSTEFYAMYAKGVLRELSTSIENLVSNAKEFFSKLAPKVSLSDPVGQYDLNFGIGYDSNDVYTPDILDIPQRIAQKRKINIIVCIDEFQQIGEFKDSLSFQKTLRSVWQHHQNVAYCLYGSKRNMMSHIFSDYNSPFYKFGDIFFLPKIENNIWIDYISERFENTGKRISADKCSRIANLVENHPYYVQQLAQMVWLRSEEECTEEDIDEALNGILNTLNMQYWILADSLTEKQLGYLMAIADGETNLSSENIIRKYRYGSSANIKNIKNTLEKKDLIDISGKKITIQDPMLKLWLKQNYKIIFV